MELRKDYILNRWVIIAESRKLRPRQFTSEQNIKSDATCYFCPGHEDLTPPETGRVQEGPHWKLRWFPNLYGVASANGSPEVRTDNSFYTFGSSYGYHEIIAETPDHSRQIYDLSESELALLFSVYRERIRDLGSLPNISYVSLFKNHGKEGGASLVHSHTQLIATSFFPPQVQEELDAVARYDSCPYCRIIQGEKDSARRCFESEHFIAFTPYASRFNYEIILLAKGHIRTMEEIDDPLLDELATMAKKILSKIAGLNASFNFFIHYSPAGKDLHFHLEFLPRIAILAGFEYCSGVVINSVSPETAAAYYRGE